MTLNLQNTPGFNGFNDFSRQAPVSIPVWAATRGLVFGQGGGSCIEHLLVEEVGSLGVALVFCVCVEHGQVLRVERHFVLTKGRIAQGERGLNGSRIRYHLIAGVGG